MPTFQMTIRTPEQVRGGKLSKARAVARLTKRELCLELVHRGIFSDADGVAAAEGRLPGALNPFLAQLTPQNVRDARIEWAGAVHIERMDTNILIFASVLGIDEDVVDDIFGIVI